MGRRRLDGSQPLLDHLRSRAATRPVEAPNSPNALRLGDALASDHEHGDDEFFAILDRELERQNTTLQLIASENFAPPPS